MNTKYRMESFALYDYQGVERHLERMEARGWRLEHTGLFWKYRRVEPQQVHYAVTYIPGLSEFDPVPTREQTQLRELCAAAGWEEAGDWLQMQIFRTEQPDPLPLETEDAVRLDVLRRAGRKFVVQQNILLILMLLLMLTQNLFRLFWDPVRTLSMTSWMLAMLGLLLAFLVTAGNLLDYVLWIRRSERSVAQGGPCAPSSGYRWLARIFWPLYGVALLGSVLAFVTEGSPQILPVLLLYLAGLVLLILLVRGVKEGLRRRGVNKSTNKALTVAADVLGAVVLVGGFSALIFWGITQQGWFLDQPAAVYEIDGFQFKIYHDDLPLTVEDLTGLELENYSYERTEYNSPLLGYLRGSQWYLSIAGTGEPGLSYEVVTVRAPFLYDWCLSEYLEEYEKYPDREYRPEDPYPWNAQAAYRLWWDGEADDRWLLCWEDRIVELNADWVLTDQQKEITAERLTNLTKDEK